MGRVTVRRRASHVRASEVTQRPETLVVEEPLEIRLNGSPLTVTMRTPGSDFELAQGFLLSEGVIADRGDIVTVRYCRGATADGTNTYNVLDVTLAPGVPMPDVDIRRNFYTTSSCGICGKASLDAVAAVSRHSPGDDATIVAGETASHLTVALLQSVLIVGVGSLVFGVSWGDPVAATALVVVWALVGTGAGVLAGSLFRTPEQATAIGVSAGMAAGMLGGCMWPLEIVGDTMRTVGHAMPHAWAVDAWVELLSRGGGLGDIAAQLAVLAGFAAVLLTAATLRLRARLTA